MPEASNREILRTPLLPAKTPWVKAGTPVPLGLTTPIPVITARRFMPFAILQLCHPERNDHSFPNDQCSRGICVLEEHRQSKRIRNLPPVQSKNLCNTI